MKVCFKCKRTKALSEFYRHARMGDGHLNKCKDCTKADVSARRSFVVASPEGKTAELLRGREKYERLYSGGRQQNRTRSGQWGSQHLKPIHSQVGNAVRDGKLRKAAWCQLCWTPGVRLHGHHEDYSKPLDVVWLCDPCHGLTRRKPLPIYQIA